MAEQDPGNPFERPAGACVTCPPPRDRAWTRAADRYATCDGCYSRLRASLDEIAERYLRLDPRPGGQGEMGGRGAPGFSSRPPLSLHVVSMRDPRSSQDARTWRGRDGRLHQEDVRPPMSVYGTLSTLAWSVAEHRDVAGPGDRDDEFMLLRFLDVHIDYVTRHAELAVEVDAQLRELVSVLRPVTGDRRHRVGKCPRPQRQEDVACRCGHGSAQHDNDAAAGERRCHEVHCGCRVFIPLDADPVEEEPERCGEMLFAPADSTVTEIRCRRCGHVWAMDQWLTLGDSIESDLEPAETG